MSGEAIGLLVGGVGTLIGLIGWVWPRSPKGAPWDLTAGDGQRLVLVNVGVVNGARRIEVTVEGNRRLVGPRGPWELVSQGGVIPLIITAAPWKAGGPTTITVRWHNGRRPSWCPKSSWTSVVPASPPTVVRSSGR